MKCPKCNQKMIMEIDLDPAEIRLIPMPGKPVSDFFYMCDRCGILILPIQGGFLDLIGAKVF